MKCFTCVHFWYYPPDHTSPYGEQACLVADADLFGTLPEDVANCPDYKAKEVKLNDHSTIING